MTNKSLHLYFTRTAIPQGSITIFADIPGFFWTIRHLTDHWPHDLHDLEERRLILLRE